MTSLLRKFTWWLQRRRKEDELREELQFHLRGGSERTPGRRAAGRPGPMGRAPRPGQRDAAAGGHAHAVVVDPARAAGAGRPLRPAVDGQEPHVHGARRPVARARHRREHGDLQLHGLDPAALAAGVGSGVARRREVAEQAHQLRPAANEFVLHSIDGSTYRDRSGVTAAIFPFPAFERLQEASAPVLSSLFAHKPAGRVNVMIKGEAELAQGEYVSGDFFRGLAVVARGGPPDLCRRRSRRRRAGRGPELRLQRAALRQRGRRDRTADSHQQRAVHRDRRRAGGVLRCGSGRRAAGLSPHARQLPLRPGCGEEVRRPELLLGRDDGTAASRH